VTLKEGPSADWFDEGHRLATRLQEELGSTAEVRAEFAWG